MHKIEAKMSELEDKSFSTHLWGHRYRMHGIQFDFAKFNSSQLVSVSWQPSFPIELSRAQYFSDLSHREEILPGNVQSQRGVLKAAAGA